MKSLSVCAVLFLLVAHGPARAEVPRQLRVCADSNDFAPFTYTGRRGTDGYNVDYLKAMLTPEERTAVITRLPWIRCLAMAADGQFDVVLDAVKVASRAAEFVYPQAHYKLTPIILFRKGFKLPAIKVAADLRQLKQCQVLGWDYSLAGIPQDNDGVTKPATQAAAITMLRAGRCDIMVYDLELIPGVQLGPQQRSELDFIHLPWLANAELHMMVSRAVPYAEELVNLINRGVERLEKSGEATRLLARHVGRTSVPVNP